jgi:hypothetical protein
VESGAAVLREPVAILAELLVGRFECAFGGEPAELYSHGQYILDGQKLETTGLGDSPAALVIDGQPDLVPEITPVYAMGHDHCLSPVLGIAVSIFELTLTNLLEHLDNAGRGRAGLKERQNLDVFALCELAPTKTESRKLSILARDLVTDLLRDQKYKVGPAEYFDQ